MRCALIGSLLLLAGCDKTARAPTSAPTPPTTKAQAVVPKPEVKEVAKAKPKPDPAAKGKPTAVTARAADIKIVGSKNAKPAPAVEKKAPPPKAEVAKAKSEPDAEDRRIAGLKEDFEFLPEDVQKLITATRAKLAKGDFQLSGKEKAAIVDYGEYFRRDEVEVSASGDALMLGKLLKLDEQETKGFRALYATEPEEAKAVIRLSVERIAKDGNMEGLLDEDREIMKPYAEFLKKVLK